MINKLKFKAVFASSGKTISGEHNFQKGLTGITGKNEAGKSMRIEMIRYALFGTKALRASVSGYTTLEATLTFTVKGTDSYTVMRNKKGTDKLLRGTNELASGTKPVNAAIERVLGYNMEVFDVTNACLQGEVEALTNKTPAERKRMIDKTLGLDALDDMLKEVRVDTNSNKKVIEALKSDLTEPTCSQEPTKYQKASKLQERMQKLETQKTEAIQLKAWLNNAVLEEPEEPVVTVMDDIEEYQNSRQKIADEVRELEFQMSKLISEPSHPYKGLKEMKLCHQFVPPEHTADQLAEMRNNYDLIDKFNKAQPIRDQLEVHENNMTACPECGHHFSLHEEAIASLKAQLEGVPDKEPEVPELTKDQIESEQQTLLSWAGRPEGLEWEKPELSLEEIAKVEDEYEQMNQFIAIQDVVLPLQKQLEAMPDRSEDFVRKQKEAAALAEYEIQKQKYDTAMEKKDTVEERIKELEGVEQKLETTKARWMESVDYEKAYAAYETMKADYDNKLKNIETKQVDYDEQMKVQDAIGKLKPRVKAYVIPSLNRVSSNFINQMTNGERSLINVDEQFNIAVDGQPVETLSGSAKSVTNLALRIGLGTVLTNKVFSVFLGDEIDAAMDANRAAYTTQCLLNLEGVIDQIILVSHQKLDFENKVEL